MSLTVGTKLHGFTVDRVREVKEMRGTLVEMSHDKTGASLCWLDNGEVNKLFSIAFKTLPEDSTGVFHILEHSVLCGSEKFPVREPFVELLKSSMNTFLNAMTFPDKTMYPVSSRNEQDFLNLTEVYLDAVFAPRIFQNPNIFYQEGWHVELTDADAEPTFKGVVFNEMKGAMSSVDEVVQEGMLALVYPDSSYGHNSGGDPRHIPELSYEQFIASYKRYYHPTNSRIFLDGAVPLDRVLGLIDSYLSRFEKSAASYDFTYQKPAAVESTNYYEVAAGESLEGKAQLTLGKIIGDWSDVVKCRAMDVICDVIAGSNEAPLKRALLAAGLCQDMVLMAYDGLLQPAVLLQIKNTDDSKSDDIRRVIRETVQGLVEKGLDRAALEASLNRFEFRIREPQEPQGLMRCINACNAWLYGGDPLMYLVNDETFAALRAMLESGGYEALLKEMLLDEETLCVLHTLPSATYGEELRAEEAARLQAIKAAWTEEDKANILALNASLAAWQQTPDTPEQLSTLPVLDLSEVSPDPMKTETAVEEISGVTVLRHSAPCHGIAHIAAYYDLTDCTLEELTKLFLLSKLLGKLPTARHDAAQLQQAVKTYLGALNFSVEAFAKDGQTDACAPKLAVRCSVLEENLPKAKELIHEILTETCFDDAERIREIVLQLDEEGKQMGIMAGHRLGMLVAGSHATAAGAVEEAVSGYSALKWLHGFAANFDAQVADYAALAKAVLARAVCRARMTLSVTAPHEIPMADFVALWPEGEAAPAAMSAKSALPHRLAIRIPAQIGYACNGLNLYAEGQKPSGSLAVASNILDLDFLWNKIRVQGGAYGAGIRAGRSGDMGCYTFRDPTPARSLDVYHGMADHLKEICASGEKIDKYIISSISNTEPLRSPREAGKAADTAWFLGRSYEDDKAYRGEILSATPEKLTAWCDALTKLASDAPVCVVGNEEAIKGLEGFEVVDL